jgi:hypothetical protein
MRVTEFADLILAIRESIPDLLPPDKTIKKRINWARRLSPRFVQSMATGLETSPVWQASADAKPDELRQNLDRSNELRPLAEQADALNTLVQFNTDSHHFVAADKARVAYNVGNRLGGKEGKRSRRTSTSPASHSPKRHKAATAKFIAEPGEPSAQP